MTPSETAKQWMCKVNHEFDRDMDIERKAIEVSAGDAMSNALHSTSRKEMICAVSDLQKALASAHRWLALNEARSILGMDDLIEQMKEQEGE